MTNLKLININNHIQDDKKLILQGLLNKKQKYLLPKYFYDEKKVQSYLIKLQILKNITQQIKS